MGRHTRISTAAAARLGVAAAGAAVLATTTSALLPHADAAPLTLTVTRAAASTAVSYTCDLQSPPEFGDPANPDTITNRACSYVDDQGRTRSFDPWIDGQLLQAGR